MNLYRKLLLKIGKFFMKLFKMPENSRPLFCSGIREEIWRFLRKFFKVQEGSMLAWYMILFHLILWPIKTGKDLMFEWLDKFNPAQYDFMTDCFILKGRKSNNIFKLERYFIDMFCILNENSNVFFQFYCDENEIWHISRKEFAFPDNEQEKQELINES